MTGERKLPILFIYKNLLFSRRSLSADFGSRNKDEDKLE
jgi:hypothetical protein